LQATWPSPYPADSVARHLFLMVLVIQLCRCWLARFHQGTQRRQHVPENVVVNISCFLKAASSPRGFRRFGGPKRSLTHLAKYSQSVTSFSCDSLTYHCCVVPVRWYDAYHVFSLSGVRCPLKNYSHWLSHGSGSSLPS
jgi:hypothetical protein